MGNHLSGCLKARAGAPDAVSLREGDRDEYVHIIRTKKIIRRREFLHMTSVCDVMLFIMNR